MPKQRKLPLNKLPPLAEPKIGDRICTRYDGSTAYGRVKDRFLDWFHVELEDGGTMVKLGADELWKVREQEVRHADPR